MSPRIGKAFVLGAGLGVRLRPLTNALPKPLLPVFGKPIIAFALEHLREAGVSAVAINTHYLAHHFDGLLPDRSRAGLSVQLFHEPVLLETGGGMKNVEDWVSDEPFLTYSGDLVCDLDIRSLIEWHFDDANDATLALRHTGLSTSVAYNPESRRVVDIAVAPGASASGNYDFAGISVWNPTVFGRIEAGRRLSMGSVLIEWLRAGARIGGVVLDGDRWFNTGSRKEYFTIHDVVRREAWSPSYLAGETPPWPCYLHPSATAAPGAVITGSSWIGAGCLVESDVTLETRFSGPVQEFGPIQN